MCVMLYEINREDFENVIIYLRKSRADDPCMTVEEVLASHERQLQEYSMTFFGAKIPEERIFREVVSGETIADRPVMKEVMTLLETGIIKGVLVIEPQRLSRGDLEDCGKIINTFRYTNTLVITPSKTYNISDEYDRKFFEMELTRGNDYLEYTKRILSRGKLASVKQGNFIGSVAPYGYKKVTKGTGKDTYHTLEIIPEQAEAVRLMFKLYLEGNGFTNISICLDRLGYKPLKSQHWSPAAISDILENPVYTGKIRWNYFKTVKKMQNGQIIKSRPINRDTSDVIIVPGKHEAIIDQKIFDAALERRGSTPKVKKGNELKNPFAGLLFCGTAGCGRSMSFKQYKDYRSKTDKRSEYMLCTNQRICHTKSVQYSAFVAKVKESLQASIKDFEVKLKAEQENADDLRQNIIKNLEAEISRLKIKDARQKDAYEDGLYSKEEYAKRNAKLQEQLYNAMNTLRQEKSATAPSVDYEEKIIRFKDCLAIIDDTTVSAGKKNELLKSCIERINYYNNCESKPGLGRYVDNPFHLEVILRL